MLTAADAPVVAQRTRADIEREKRYRAESDLQAITRANEIASDKVRMREVQKLAAEQASSLSKIAGKRRR